MNPYIPPAVTSGLVRSRPHQFLLLSIASLVLAALIAAPELSLLTANATRPIPTGARYATYDPELSIFGVDLEPSTVIAVSVAIGFILLLFSLILALLWRWRRPEGATSTSPVVSEETQTNSSGLEPRPNRWFATLLMVARLLWIAPLILAIPTFYIVAESVPDLNRGSIGDGFRKMNVYLSVMGPLAAICWGSAFLLTIFHDLRPIPRSRIFIWLTVFSMLVAITITLAVLDR